MSVKNRQIVENINALLIEDLSVAVVVNELEWLAMTETHAWHVFLMDDHRDYIDDSEDSFEDDSDDVFEDNRAEDEDWEIAEKGSPIL